MDRSSTFRNALLVLAGCASLAAAPSIAHAQDEQPQRARLVARAATPALCDIDPTTQTVHDARARIARLSRGGDGTVLIDRASGLQLVGHFQGGRIQGYSLVGTDGGPVPSYATPTTGADCNPCCWKCGKDSGGTVHCWQVECPVITSGEGDEG